MSELTGIWAMGQALSPASGRNLEESAPTAGGFELLLRPLGVDGVYARTRRYEEVVERLGALFTRQGDKGAEVLRFPPVMSRRHVEKSGYLSSFPNLLGCVCALHGSDSEIAGAAERHGRGEDWTRALSASDLVLSPAACYPVYPLAAERGPVPNSGLVFDVAADCFRHEPSKDADRLQSFRMREFVRIDSADAVLQFRDEWLLRAQRIAGDLGLPHRVAPASDPFFGRVGQMKAVSQMQQALKFELLVPIRGEGPATACMSFNYHREHFGTVWKLILPSGEVAHTGCVAFGIDRLAIALFSVHGPNPGAWPRRVRVALELS